jgi:hypothetical protein
MNQAAAPDALRRNLLLALGAGSVGAAALASPVLNLAASAPGDANALGWWERMFHSLAHGSAEEWAAIRGQVFAIEGEHGSVPVLLSEVALLPSKGVRPREVSRQRAFSLTFLAAPDRAPAGDRTYRLTHASFPALDIHLSPARRLPRGVRLSAVFN